MTEVLNKVGQYYRSWSVNALWAEQLDQMDKLDFNFSRQIVKTNSQLERFIRKQHPGFAISPESMIKMTSEFRLVLILLLLIKIIVLIKIYEKLEKSVHCLRPLLL